MNYEKIIQSDCNNGDGIAVTLFVTGCPLHCKGCQNESIQDPEVGQEYTRETQDYILNLLGTKEVNKHLSILGGEPLADYNIDTVMGLCTDAKIKYPDKKIWLWSGYTINEIENDLKKVAILHMIDYLVEGRFIEELKYSEEDAAGKYRGSSNQNLINIKEYFSDKNNLEKEYDEKMTRVRGFEFVSTEKSKCKKEYGEKYMLPCRATQDSAGYDFYAPYDFDLKPQEQILIWTNVKAYMPKNEMLILDTTSGNGTKKGAVLANTIGVVDSDYYNNENNEGNIGICLKNTKQAFNIAETHNVMIPVYNEKLKQYCTRNLVIPELNNFTDDNTIHFKKGDKIAQGIFVEFKEADNCNNDAERKGGFGSTDKGGNK